MRWLVFLIASPVLAQPKPLQVPFDAKAAMAGREEWAKHLGVPAEFTNDAGIKMGLIPPGSFTMGPNGHTSRVRLSKPFYIATTETTLGQYRKLKPGYRVEGSADETNADDRPAAMVSWHDAREYCDWLTKQGKAFVYSLPTEAQWEWATRAGTATPRHFGDAKGDLGLTDHAWFNHTYTPNPKVETAERGRKKVAQLKPNAWGLHDTLGNVWEWCGDVRRDDVTGEERQPTIRGGGWRSGGSHCTSTAFDPMDAKAKNDHTGFRVVAMPK